MGSWEIKQLVCAWLSTMSQLEKTLAQGDVRFHSHFMVRLYASRVAASERSNINEEVS
jgi:hypothetical protein